MLLQNTEDKQNNESGFIILTIPVLLILFGFFVSTIMNDVKPNQFYFETTTQEKMEEVKLALAAYAHRNYRVPCPAAASADNGVENLNGAGDCASQRGVLPYQELGLTAEYAMDEWGHLLTYKVSPDFTRGTKEDALDKVSPTANDSTSELLLTAKDEPESYVHELCRTGGWVDADKDEYVQSDGNIAKMTKANTNKNIYKARFCCPSNVNGPGNKAFASVDEKKQEGGRSVNFGSGAIILTAGPPNSKVIGLKGKYSWSQTRYDAGLTNYDKLVLDYQDSLAHGGDGFGPLSTSEKDGTKYVLTEGEGKLPLGDGNGNSSSGEAIRYVDGDPNSPTYGQVINQTIGHNSGKFYYQSAVFTVDGNEKAKDMTFTMGDLDGNENLPVYASMQFNKADGSPLDLKGKDVGVIIQNPSTVEKNPTKPTHGVGDLKITLDYFRSGNNPYDDPSLPRSEGGLYSTKTGGDDTINYNRAKADFLASRNNLMKALGITLSDPDALSQLDAELNGLSLAEVEMNGAPASLGFKGVSYGAPTAPTNTDLVILDGSGNARLTARDDPASYGSANSTHSGAVTQDFEAAAYALISHGEDGEGAFVAGSANPINNIDDDDENPQEVANHSDVAVKDVVDTRKISSSDRSKQFDDIVMWDSQITLYNALRNGTCENAQAL